jgi:hypothetical protein
MRTSKTSIGVAVALTAGALALGMASTANAGVTTCAASGGKQEAGAVIGAVLGGLLGNAVGGHHAAGETVAGAALGAAAGSAVGCEAQKSAATRASYDATYRHDGYRLQSNLQPARYERLGGRFVAVTSVTMRAGPTTRSARVGRLPAGARFQALASVRGADWVLVGQDGVGVGYVRSEFVRPAGYRRRAD